MLPFRETLNLTPASIFNASSLCLLQMWINILVFSRHYCIPAALYILAAPWTRLLQNRKTCSHGRCCVCVCAAYNQTSRNFHFFSSQALINFDIQLSNGQTRSSRRILMQLFLYIFYVCYHERLFLKVYVTISKHFKDLLQLKKEQQCSCET